MLFEELDKKIKDAANSHHPAYQENAWGKMEELLDQHMPVKEKQKRRFILWWMIPVIMGAGFGIYKIYDKQTNAKKTQATLNYKNENNSNIKEIEKQNLTNKAEVNENNQTEISSTKPGTSNPTTNIKDRSNKESIVNTSADNPLTVSNSNKPKNEQREILGPESKTSSPFINKAEKNNFVKQSNPDYSLKKSVVKKVPAAAVSSKEKNTFLSSDKQQSSTEDGTIISSDSKQPETEKTAIISPNSQQSGTNTSNEIKNDAATQPITDEIKNPISTKAKKQKTNTLFFTASIGPDFSFVAKNKSGQTKIFNGIGAGYTFNNKFTIRVGFYNSLKIYSADAGSYKGSSNFYQYIPYLESVDANCRIYEVPIAFSYNFYNTKKQTLFASTALSTVIMKRESYDYYYRYTPTGNIYKKSSVYRNENKHILSMLTLSAGYQRNLGNKLFIIAEPYYKIPLKGIGAGNIKLNSAGLQMSVGIKLF